MSLSCDCGFDDYYDSFYTMPNQEYSANSAGKCYGCGDAINIGDEVQQIHTYEMDDEGYEKNCRIMGRICEKCSGHYEALNSLGYCLTSDNNFIAHAMDEYRDMLPSSHIIKSA